MAYTTSLLTVPKFTFYQDNEEFPINVNYYNGSVELEQRGESIYIDSKSVDALFKAIKKHLSAAVEQLNKRK